MCLSVITKKHICVAEDEAEVLQPEGSNEAARASQECTPRPSTAQGASPPLGARQSLLYQQEGVQTHRTQTRQWD